MTDTPDTTTANIDALAGWLDVYRESRRARDTAQEAMDLARGKIEAALGDAEVGTVRGVPAVRWTHTTTRRLDQKLLKATIPADVLATCYLESRSRRFTTVDGDGGDA